MKAKIIKDALPGFQGDACLVAVGERIFVVSSLLAHQPGGPETLAFCSDLEGQPNWSHICGGSNLTREEVIGMLEREEYEVL